MEDENFLKELEEMTKTMEKEFSNENVSSGNKIISNKSSGNLNSVNSSNFPGHNIDFNMNFDGNGENYMKELQKLLQMNTNGGMNFNDLDDIDENDPQAKEMFKQLSNF